MNSISFCGGETAGSVAKLNNDSTTTIIEPKISFRAQGAETAGSISKQNIDTTPAKDTLTFKGRDDDDSSSFAGTLFKFTLLAAATVLGLGYAHKTNAVSKIKNEKIKDFLKNSNKITEPCYNACCKIKDFFTKYYDKAKAHFNK